MTIDDSISLAMTLDYFPLLRKAHQEDILALRVRIVVELLLEYHTSSNSSIQSATSTYHLPLVWNPEVTT